MRKIRLEYFQNICASCGTEFRTLQLPQDVYGPVLVTTKMGDAAFVFPDESEVWGQLEKFVNRALSRTSLSGAEKADVFDRALALTLDPSPNGERYYVWGNTPCPKCDVFERDYIGPVEPPEIVEIEARSATHSGWNVLSLDEREEVVRNRIHDFLKTGSEN